MGCCTSTIAKASPPGKSNASLFSGRNRPPPRPALPLHDEETVKEVLPVSESLAPNPKPALSKIEDVPKKAAVFPSMQCEKDNGQDDPKKPAEEVSEASEICSTLRESVSTTTTLTDKRDADDGEVIQKVVINKSPARLRSRPTPPSVDPRRDRATGGSPAGRRPDSNSGRVRSVQGRRRSVQGRGRSGSASEGRRSGAAGLPGRRSRSPATRKDGGGGGRTGLGRNHSVGKNPDSGETGPKDPKSKAERILGDGDGDATAATTTTNESLENPLVSLECFIFL